METRYLLSDIIEMLRLIKNDALKQNIVSRFIEGITNVEKNNETSKSGEYDELIPPYIMDMLLSIKYDGKKLLKVLSFIEDEILEKKEDKDELEMIHEFKTIIPQIIESLENGFIVYLNPETLETEEVENKTVAFLDELEEQNDDLMDEYELEYMKWDNYIKLEPLDYEDTTTITEDFVRQLEDSKLATRLEDVLSINNSLDEFCDIVKGSEKINEQWQNFKRKSVENYVKSQLIGRLKGYKREKTTELILDETL